MIPWKRRRNKRGRRAERGSNKEQAIRFNEVAPLSRIDLRSLRLMDETNPIFKFSRALIPMGKAKRKITFVRNDAGYRAMCLI
jgi:hypothetical protein